MSGIIDARLRELTIELPQPSTPGANYLPSAAAIFCF